MTSTQEVATIPSLGALASGLKRTRNSLPSFGGKAFLKFGKDGVWSTGKAGDSLNGDRLLLNTASIKAGYVCWTNYPASEKKKNEKLGEEMKAASMGSVDPLELPDTGWDWKQQLHIEGRFLDGDKQEVQYTTSSLGGVEALDHIIEEITESIDAGEEIYLFPIVELKNDWYEHTQWGKTYKPIIEIVGWADINGNPEPDDETAAIEKEAAPEPVKQAEEPATEDGEADAPPVRRRRR